MKKPQLKTLPLVTGSEKALEIFGFSGLYDSMRKNGMLLDADNVHVLSGGAVASLLAAKKIDITVNMPVSIEGVYTYYDIYDPHYETPTTPEWVYANVCPADIMNYAEGMTAASRLLIADVGKPAKTENGYRNVVSAFADDENIYILYDAIYNLIDQRRSDQFSAHENGYMVEFDAHNDEDAGTWSKVCTLTQVFLDVIGSDGSVTTQLLTANLEELEKLSALYAESVMLSTDGENFQYVSSDYHPAIGTSYNFSYDRVYTMVYPTLATAYDAIQTLPVRAQRIVRYRNRADGTEPYGSEGEKLLLLPDMQLLSYADGAWKLAARSATIPLMRAAVQHFERLFGIYGNRVYASVAGDCTDYTEAVDNLPACGGWQAITGDPGGYTAIASFDGKLILFTACNMMIVRGVDLPFSLSAVGAFGCFNQESLAVCGDWLYFISESGVLRYNGSRVETISDALPFGLRYADARLTVAEGLVLVYLDEFDGVYIYDPQSEGWSHYGGDANVHRFVGYGSRMALLRENGAILPYALFDTQGQFSFSIALVGGGRRRVRSISVTARLAPEAKLILQDASGRELLCMDQLYDETATRTCLVRGMYTDGGALHFAGSGEVMLYGVRITYAPMANAARKIR